MKKWLKIWICILLMCVGVFGHTKDIKAASFNMGASTTTVAPGGTFTVTISGQCIGRVNFSVSNGTLSSSAEWIENNAVSVTVKAGSSGTVVVTASPTEGFSDADGNPYNPGSRSVSVSIVNKQSGGGSSSSSTSRPQADHRSKNNNLAALSISEGTLSPSFNASVTEYSVDLSATTTKIKIDAKTADTKASVKGTGEIAVEAGENKLSITVTAENGSQKVYTIIATVDEKPSIYLDYKNNKLGVVRNLRNVEPLSGFKETTLTLEGVECKAWYSEEMDKTILYLIDEKANEKCFYIYDTKEGKVVTFIKPVTIGGKLLYMVDVEDVKDKEGFKYTDVTIDETAFKGWKYNEKTFKDYSLIYVMNTKGEMKYYQYEASENTLQLYDGSAPITQKEYDKLCKELEQSNMMKMIFMGTSLLLLIIVILLLWQYLKNKNKA